MNEVEIEVSKHGDEWEAWAREYTTVERETPTQAVVALASDVFPDPFDGEYPTPSPLRVPDVEVENGLVRCPCGEELPAHDAAITADIQSSQDGVVVDVRRVYLCSQECAGDVAAGALDVVQDVEIGEELAKLGERFGREGGDV